MKIKNEDSERMTRNIDIQPESAYIEATNRAANDYVNEAGAYANSYQALGYKKAFTLGADTADTLGFDDDFLLAVIAGRRWALAEQKPARS